MEYTLCYIFKLWSLINEWTGIKKIWINTPIVLLDFNKISQYIRKIQEDTFSVESGKYM